MPRVFDRRGSSFYATSSVNETTPLISAERARDEKIRGTWGAARAFATIFSITLAVVAVLYAKFGREEVYALTNELEDKTQLLYRREKYLFFGKRL